ncbi:hypothetical protein LSAT2_004302 [Lamellibrachia satsuma]|nr:hypothetical protein LSAT2_004302 [Lamellibrachia satsuma]
MTILRVEFYGHCLLLEPRPSPDDLVDRLHRQETVRPRLSLHLHVRMQRNQPGVTLMGAAALRSKGFMQLVQFTLRVCGQAIQYIMTWVKRVQFRVVRGRYTCILCALMMYFTYWVYDQFGYQWLGLVVEEPTSSTGVRWKTLYESAVVRTRLTLSQNKHVAVIGGYGSFAATRAAAMRLDKYQVVLASPYGATINRNDHTALNTCLDRATSTRNEEQTPCHVAKHPQS